MKHLISYVFLVVLATSCTVIQEDYYGSGYYNPPPQIEVHRYYPETYPNEDVHVHRSAYRPRPYQGPVTHGHSQSHNQVLVTPGRPQVHGHGQYQRPITPAMKRSAHQDVSKAQSATHHH